MHLLHEFGMHEVIQRNWPALKKDRLYATIVECFGDGNRGQTRTFSIKFYDLTTEFEQLLHCQGARSAFVDNDNCSLGVHCACNPGTCTEAARRIDDHASRVPAAGKPNIQHRVVLYHRPDAHHHGVQLGAQQVDVPAGFLTGDPAIILRSSADFVVLRRSNLADDVG